MRMGVQNKKKNKNHDEEDNSEEYGVILKKGKYKKKVFPQKGKKPEPEETDTYKVV